MVDCTQDWYKVWRKTDLCFQKLTWGIWQIFTRAPESLQIGTLMVYFCLKLNMCELKIYRGVMCHDHEEWCKNWRVIDLSVQNWHEEFENLQWSYVSWPRRMMQKLKRNWLVSSKLIWGIWRILTWALENLKKLAL